MIARLFAASLGLIALVGCGPSSVDFICLEDEPLCSIDEILERDLPLATGVSVTKVAYYQAAEQILAEGGVESTDYMPMVEGRDALFRVWVSAASDYQSRTILARVFLYQGDSLVDVRESELSLIAGETSEDSDTGSTFNVLVPGSSIGPELSYSIELVEAAEDVKVGGNDSGAVFPASGAAAVQTDSSGPALTVYMVPVQYDADGSGRTPPTDEDFLREFQDLMYAYYPTPEVEFIVGDVLPWSQAINANGQGFDTVLSAVGNLRASRDDIPPYAYIYGYFQPANSAEQFCAAGCVAGLSNLSNSGSVGLGYTGQADTMVHEVGHAHGRSHAPGCGAAGADPSYPYTEGGQGMIGVRGYNLISGEFYDPETYVDVMSYCYPQWISDFNFQGLFNALEATNSARTERALPAPWRVLWVMSDGRVEWGPDQQLTGPRGYHERRVVELLDADGEVIAEVKAHYSPFDHLPGGQLLFPASLDPGAAQVRFQGQLSDLR
ncbi:MAG: hypothetical protein H6741_14605 [Alphaproteobacteria bacterium]|nr:hypothetical protein [Alphaproteobacteria bacterium]MCB9793948.1 hypothetical protein [Alphaproteobacteria bacterium]